MEQQQKTSWKTIRRLLGYLGAYKLRLFFILFFLVMATVGSVRGMLSLKTALDQFLVPLIGQQNPDLTAFFWFVVTLGLVYLGTAVSNFMYSRLMVKVSTGILHRIRVELFAHMQTLPLRVFDTTPHGELMSRFTNDTDTLREMFSTALTESISGVVQLLAIIGAMCYLSPHLAVLALVSVSVMLLSVRFLGSRSSFYFGKQQANLGRVNGYLEELIEGQKVVKVFNHEEQAIEDFRVMNDDLRLSARGATTYANLLMPILMNLSYAQFAVTAMVGALLSISLGLGVGTIGSFLNLSRNLGQPLSQASQHFNTILKALAGAERIFTIMDLESETDQGAITLVNTAMSPEGEMIEREETTGNWAWKIPTEEGQVYVPLKGEIVFTDVSFNYDPDKPVLKEINMYAKAGQKIALVGSTGAGKTTITNLLNRFYDITQGSITYDGIDIKEIKKGDLRRSLAMVLQDTHLFTGTVADNIRYGRLDATTEQVLAAAKLANADSFIDTLPKRYDTPLSGEGSSLSQGQRQLLSIARAAVANPPALILDEATSSVDTRTEAIIGQGMDQLMEGRTSLVIAHRLSTIQDANVILVMEQGEIIERGDHGDLLKEKGRYYQLYTGAIELE